VVFSSITFLVYILPVFLILLHVVPQSRKNIFILLFSIFFYSWGGPKFIVMILATTLLDFLIAGKIHASKNEKTRKIWLCVSLCINLGLLFYFKYLFFFGSIIQNITGWDLGIMKVVLPIGISFYTFESITYLVDVYRRVHAPLKNFWDYQTYIFLFPKLIAGPIVRYHEIADQIDPLKRPENYKMRLSGISIFCVGLAKKTILANTLGHQADAVFKLDPTSPDSLMAWTGTLAYTLQIYFDFSGYSDMAVGLCKIMGFRIPDNFFNPYTSGSITEFWRKWHITLGRWMKNYLYIPLGGNKNGKFRTFLNLWIVFLLSGLWHGAGWNFIIWGIYHGTFLVTERIIGLERFQKIPYVLRWIYSFMVVMTGWVFFRVEDLQKAMQHISVMYSFKTNPSHFVLHNDFTFMAGVGLIFAIFIWLPFGKKIQEWWWSDEAGSLQKNIMARLVTCILLYMLSLSFLTSLNFNPFIYFRF